MYGDAANSASGGCQERLPGMYDKISSAVSRAHTFNQRITDLLGRFRGNQPSVATMDKSANVSQPSFLDVGRNLQTEFDYMDKQIQELADLIG